MARANTDIGDTVTAIRWWKHTEYVPPSIYTEIITGGILLFRKYYGKY